MNKAQILLIFSALVLMAGLFLLGPTKAPGKKNAPAEAQTQADTLDFLKLKSGVTANLSPERQQYIAGVEAEVKRGDVKDQLARAYQTLATFWKDSVPTPPLHFYYLSEGASLDNTEKSLTFAAHSILGYLPYAHNQKEQVWLANRGKELFEKALAMNPNNDSTVVGLGGTIMYGASAESGPMAGILKVREVAEKDSTNLFAQYMLGIGGLFSGQYDKAAQRFEKVVSGQPDNIEAYFKLAEACELAGDKAAAIKWYEVIDSKITIPEMKAELQKRIKELRS